MRQLRQQPPAGEDEGVAREWVGVMRELVGYVEITMSVTISVIMRVTHDEDTFKHHITYHRVRGSHRDRLFCQHGIRSIGRG